MHSVTRELLAYLDEQRSVLKSAFESIPVELRELSPAPERWSAANVVEHLAIVETRVSKLLADRIEEARPELSPSTHTAPILPGIDYKRMYDRSTRVKAPETAIPTGLDAAAAWSGCRKRRLDDARSAYQERWSWLVIGHAPAPEIRSVISLRMDCISRGPRSSSRRADPRRKRADRVIGNKERNHKTHKDAQRIYGSTRTVVRRDCQSSTPSGGSGSPCDVT